MTRIIADACANHCSSRDIMLAMIKAAAGAGIDVIKWQSFRADKLRRDWPDYEDAYAYYKAHELSEDDHRWIINKCRQHKIEPLFTCFDLETVDFLFSLGLDRVKISSPDANSWVLIDKCLDKFEHIIISTGMHSQAEIVDLANYLAAKNALPQVTAMHCVSLYPTPPDKVNMLRLGWMMRMFHSVGFSDHTIGTEAAKLAISLGAACVEKHFSLDRRMPGKDQLLSAEVDEFRELAEWRDMVQMLMYSPDEFPDEGARVYINKWGCNR